MSYPSTLFDYLALDFPDYTWKQLGEPTLVLEGVTRLDVHLVSQKWQGILWAHHLHLFVPELQSTELSDQVLLTIAEDGPASLHHAGRSAAMAAATGMVCAVLCDVPNQPLYDGLVEDALIAQTFLNHLDTGEAWWPLLLPMVRSASAAMSAIQELCAETAIGDVTRFVVTGASKRGWTTWLAGAADKRVSAIAPVVFDNLNFFTQMPHQLDVFDTYSEEISDYTASGIVDRMITPDGYKLVSLVDPFSYREALGLPKLIINGTNDPYWATDAINIYWEQLTGAKSVLYIPNQGHFLKDEVRFEPALAAFALETHRGAELPAVSALLTSKEDAAGVSVVILNRQVGAEIGVWWANTAPGSKDFRLSKWSYVRLTTNAAKAEGVIPGTISQGSCVAAFAECTFEGPFGQYKLSSPMQVLRPMYGATS